MELKEAQEKFLLTWGALGSNWGINRTMAQIHALLLTNEESLTTEDVMEKLNISRGSANLNIRELISWGLAFKVIKAGDRKEYFSAEKDIWKVARLIARERRKRELEPALKVLNQIQSELKTNSPDAKEFVKRIGDIEDFTSKTDSILEKFINSNNNWFVKLLASMMK